MTTDTGPRITPAAVAALVATAVIISCSDPAPPAPADTGPLTATTDKGTYEVRLETVPAPPPLNDHFRLRIEIAPPDEDIEVVADADMPEHKHGMNTLPEIERKSPGHYEVEGFLFHMPGRWELYVDVTRGGITERATFKLDVETAGGG